MKGSVVNSSTCPFLTGGLNLQESVKKDFKSFGISDLIQDVLLQNFTALYFIVNKLF